MPTLEGPIRLGRGCGPLRAASAQAVEPEFGADVLNPHRDFYDEFADWYEDHRHGGYEELIDDLESDLLRNYVFGEEVLEVGCGRGLVLERIEALADRSIGIDLNRERLERAARHGLDVARADVRELPFADESFDVVCSFKVLAHVPSVEDAIREMVRVTRPGGHLLMEFYNPVSMRFLADRVSAGLGVGGVEKTEPYTRWDPPFEVRRWLPESLELVDFAGIRVLTPAAVVHRLPWIRFWVRKLEFVARDGPLKYFGGFLVAIARKKE